MKPSLLFALLCTLTCSSCQNGQWPWNKTPANADPYATGATAAAGQYQPYPGNAAYPQAGANQNYAYPNYAPSGEQAQVTPANAAPPQNYAPQEDWSAGGAQSAAPKTAAPKVSSKGGSYLVKRGDTLSSISRNNGTTVSKLMQLNGLKSTTIRDGQSLRVR
jgi:LysM repeat protein